MEIGQHLEGGNRHVHLKGSFTFSDHGAFRDVIEAICDEKTTRMILHFRGIDFVDSAALGMLLLARDEAESCRKPLILSGATGQVKKMFDMARFGNLFSIE